MKRMSDEDPEMRPYYGFSGARRGPYVRGLLKTNRRRLDADLAEQFPTSEAVNVALRQAVDTQPEPPHVRAD